MVGKSLGPYKILEPPGAGGMGEVYVAEDPRLGRKVAIKVVGEQLDIDGADERLLREAQTASALNHPHICTIYDVGTEDGRLYMAMELVEGQPMSTILRTGALPIETAVRYSRDVAEALEHAHRHGVVHRDLKSANVMITTEGRAKVLDFGLAKQTLTEELDEVRTSRDTLGEANTGEGIAGTIHYMSPEVLRGARADERSDIWALGVVMYEAVAGGRPFKGATGFELSASILMEPVPELPATIAAGLRPVVHKCLAKDPVQRYKHAGEIRAALEVMLPDMAGVFGASPVAAASAGEAAPVASSSATELSTPVAPPIVDPEVPTGLEVPTPARPRAERRHVTLLSCDGQVRAEDPAEPLDPEDQAELVNAYRIATSAAAGQFGGTVLQSAGHGLLVSFGYPVGFEDGAQRAVHTALGMLEVLGGVSEEAAERGAALDAWIVVNTGLVVTSGAEGPEGSLSLVGEAVDVVTRMDAVTEPGVVVITESTYELVQGYFVCDELGPHRIKGAVGPVALYKVTKATEARTRLDVHEAALTPLVGRDQEVGLLRDRWELARQSMTQSVLLSGEAGIGKSRLLHVLKDQIIQEHGGPDASIIEWRCSPYHQNSGLHPVIEYLARLFDFENVTAPADRLDRIEDGLRELDLDVGESAPLLASLLSVPADDRYEALELTPQRQKERTLELVMNWLYGNAEKRPVLFIVEDLHWVDPSTLELLTLMAEQAPTEPILSLFTFRPQFTVPWMIKSHHTQVALNRLTKSQIEEMMCQKIGVPALPGPIVGQVIERTDGVPLFVEEFTKLIQESDVLAELIDGRSSIDLSRAIPHGLQDLLLARLDRMASNTEVVQLGATVGREFLYELIKTASPLDEQTLRTELDKLVAAELLYQKARPPHARYLFKHALIQDAAYESMLKKKRQQFHKIIANALLEHFPETVETQPEVMAHHFTQALELEEAAGYWLQAASRALQASANQEAVAHATSGLEVIQKLPETPQAKQLEIQMQMALGPAVMALQGYSAPEMGRAYSRARALCQELGQPPELAPVTFGLWTYHYVRAEYHMCDEMARELLDMGERADDDHIRLEGHCILALTLYYLEQMEQGREHFEKANELYDPTQHRDHLYSYGHEPGMVNSLYYSLALWWQGQPDEASSMAKNGFDIAQDAAHPYSIAFAHTFNARLHQSRGEVDECIALAEPAIELSIEHGFPLWLAYAGMMKGWALAQRGEIEESLQLFEQGLAAWDMMGALIWRPYYLALYADALGKAGEFDKASAALDEAVEIATQTDERLDRSFFERLRGELLWAKADGDEALFDRAREHFREALKIADESNAKAWQLEHATWVARTAKEGAEADAARQRLAEIYETFTQGHDTPRLRDAAELLGG